MGLFTSNAYMLAKVARPATPSSVEESEMSRCASAHCWCARYDLQFDDTLAGPGSYEFAMYGSEMHRDKEPVGLMFDEQF